jgi:hypothetical protein
MPDCHEVTQCQTRQRITCQPYLRVFHFILLWVESNFLKPTQHHRSCQQRITSYICSTCLDGIHVFCVLEPLGRRKSVEQNFVPTLTFMEPRHTSPFHADRCKHAPQPHTHKNLQTDRFSCVFLVSICDTQHGFPAWKADAAKSAPSHYGHKADMFLMYSSTAKIRATAMKECIFSLNFLEQIHVKTDFHAMPKFRSAEMESDRQQPWRVGARHLKSGEW